MWSEIVNSDMGIIKMFIKHIIRVISIAVFAILLTLGITLSIFSDGTFSSYRVWSVVGPFILSICLLAISHAKAIRAPQRSFPLYIVRLIVPWVYFVFTIMMFFSYNANISNFSLILIEAIAIFLVLIPVSITEMAIETTDAHATQDSKSIKYREHFKLQVFEIVEKLHSRFPENKALRSLGDKLTDVARYATTSVPGCEKYDYDVEKKVEEIKAYLENASESIISENIDILIALFKKREVVIKTLR